MLSVPPLTGDLRKDVAAFLIHHGCPKTAAHCIKVGAEARRMALRFGANPDLAEQAGLLHDVSAIWPSPDRVRVAREYGLEVLPEEEALPMIVHQKLSVVLAREVFGITDESVLNAVCCHTTLWQGASLMDKVLFIADKVEWDQEGTPPYLDAVLTGLDRSLDHGCLAYIHWRFESGTLLVVHPWLRDAYAELRSVTKVDQYLP